MYSTCGSRILVQETRAQRQSWQHCDHNAPQELSYVDANSAMRVRPGGEQAGFFIIVLYRLQQRVLEVGDVLETRVPAGHLSGVVRNSLPPSKFAS
jgi:hypothetical protein